MPHPSSIVISYRRGESAGQARALTEALERRYGEHSVFIDVDDLAAGEDFEQRLVQVLRAAKAVLVLIGPGWRGERSQPPGVDARLWEDDDPVRREVATALAADVPVLPVLLDATPMPKAELLPPDLQGLPRRHALVLDHRRYEDDLQRLHAALDALPGLRPALQRRSRRRLVGALGATLIMAAAAGLTWHSQRAPAPPVAAPASTPAPPPSGAALAAFDGHWVAEVSYPWQPATRRERLMLRASATPAEGSITFLGVERVLMSAQPLPGGVLELQTRSEQILGEQRSELRHRYRLRREGAALQVEMLTEGGTEPPQPLRFRAVPATDTSR